MQPDEIYSYREPRDILANCFQAKQRVHPRFSLRAWAKKLGFKNPSYLSDVINGKRKLKPDFALKISESLDLDESETSYFQTLVFLSNAKTESEKEFFQRVLEKFLPEKQKQVVEYERFPELKEWYYGVLDEMTCLSDFREDYNYLARRLSPDLSPQTIEAAIKEILKLGLLQRDGQGRLRRPRKWFYKEESNPAKKDHVQVRKYKKAFLEKAIVAIDDQVKGESFFRQTNTPIRLNDLPKLTALAEQFFESVYQLESDAEADEVFNVSLACYRLTQK